MAILAWTGFVLLGLLCGYIVGRIAHEELEESKQYFMYGCILCVAVGLAVGLLSGTFWTRFCIGSVVMLLGLLLKTHPLFLSFLYVVMGSSLSLLSPVGVAFYFLAGFPAGSIILESKQYIQYIWNVVLFLLTVGLVLLM